MSKTTITNCFNSGKISVSAGTAGGIAGACMEGTSTINCCYNSGEIVSGGNGIAGTLYITSGDSADVHVEKCYNSGDLNGGVGISNGSITRNCYNSGDGAYYGISNSSDFYFVPTIQYCYNIGTLSGDEACAITYYSDSNIDHCYFLDNKEYATHDGALFANTSKLSIDQMKDQTSFSGFDFDTVWEMGKSDYPYPVFKAIYEDLP